MGVAMLVVKPDSQAGRPPAGLVKLVTTTIALTAGATGAWIALSGAFPGTFTSRCT